MKKIVIKMIELYQKTLSPDSGWFSVLYPAGYCKYTPHCSEYAKQSVAKRGVVVGIGRGIWRVMRCNPWSKGGCDPA